MSISRIIRSAQRKAAAEGSPYVSIDHLEPAQVEELATATLNWLQQRPGKPSHNRNGWTQVSAAQAGVLRMWVADDEVLKDEAKLLRPLRRDIYGRFGGTSTTC